MSVALAESEAKSILRRHQPKGAGGKQCDCGAYTYDSDDQAKHQAKKVVQRLQQRGLITE